MLNKLDKFFLKDKYIITILLLAGFVQDQVLVYCHFDHTHAIPLLFAVIVMAYRAFRDPEFLKFRGAGIWGLFIIAFAISFAANKFPAVRGNLIDLMILLMTGFLIYGSGSSDGGEDKIRDLRFVSGVGFFTFSLNSVISLITYIAGVSIKYYELQGGYPSYVGVSYGFQDRFTGLQGVPNALGWTCACAIVWGFVWMSTIDENRKIIKLISIVLMVISAICIGLTFSRGSLLAITSGLVFYCLYRILADRRSRSGAKTAVEVILAIVLIVWIAFSSTSVFAKVNAKTNAAWYARQAESSASGNNTENASDVKKPSSAVQSDNSGNRVLSRFKSGDVSNGRGTINEIGFKLLVYNRQLLYGVSSGNGRDAWKAFVTEHEDQISGAKYEFTRNDDKISGNMHNVFTQTIYNYGLIGVIPLLLLVALFIKTVLNRLIRSENIKNKKIEAGLFMGICSVGTIAMFENILIYSTKAYNVTFMYLLGVYIWYCGSRGAEGLLEKADTWLGGWLRAIGKVLCIKPIDNTRK
jgi:O-antigen ligase